MTLIHPTEVDIVPILQVLRPRCRKMEVKPYAQCHPVDGSLCWVPPSWPDFTWYLLKSQAPGALHSCLSPGVSPGKAFPGRQPRDLDCADGQMTVRAQPSLVSYTLPDQGLTRSFCFVGVKARLMWSRLALPPEPPSLLPRCWEYRLGLHNPLAMT